MPKPQYVNSKISLLYDDDKGALYLTKQRVEPKELLFRIPLKDSLHAPREDRLILFTYPLMLELDKDESRIAKYYPYKYYQELSSMYIPIYRLDSICRGGGMCFKTVVIQFLCLLHVLYCLTFSVEGSPPYTKELFERLLHMYHIVDTRCVENKRDGHIYLVDHFDNLNHSSLPNATYDFDNKYLIVKAKEHIPPYTEVTVSYGRDLTREKTFIHYHFINNDSLSESAYPTEDSDDKAHIDALLSYILQDTFISVYDFYLKYMDDKNVVFHLEKLLS